MTAAAPPPPGGDRRSLGPLRRFLSRTGSVLLVIAALGIGDLILRFTPDVDERERPFLIAGEQGQAVDAREFTATLLKARTAGVIKAGTFIHPTQGVWVLLRMRFVAGKEPVQINYAAVVDQLGRSFYASDRLKQPLVDGSRVLQPGIGVEGEIAFEVPRDAGGLTAQFSNAGNNRIMQAVTDITLPIDEAVWLDRTPVTIEPVEVKP
jgi:hypothetical protein